MSPIDEVIALLSELISIPSVNPRGSEPEGPTGEGALARFIEKWLRDRGVEAELVERTPGRPNVIAWTEGSVDSAVLLESHLDTVEVEGMAIAPFAGYIANGEVFGRGAVDTKASLAVYMHTLARIAELPAEQRPTHKLVLLGTIDEEHTFRGVRELLTVLDRRGITAIGAISGEPTNMRLGCAHKGVIRCNIRVSGRAGHSSRPEEAQSAISTAVSVVQAIDGFMSDRQHPLLGSQTRAVTRIISGVGGNVIPGEAEIEVDIRTLPGQSHESVLEELATELDAVAPGATTLLPAHVLDWALDTDASSPLARSVSYALESAGLNGSAVGMPFGTDASKISMCNVPALVLGPGSISRAHTSDESVAVADVERLREILWETLFSPLLDGAPAYAVRVPSELVLGES